MGAAENGGRLNRRHFLSGAAALAAGCGRGGKRSARTVHCCHRQGAIVFAGSRRLHGAGHCAMPTRRERQARPAEAELRGVLRRRCDQYESGRGGRRRRGLREVGRRGSPRRGRPGTPPRYIRTRGGGRLPLRDSAFRGAPLRISIATDVSPAGKFGSLEQIYLPDTALGADLIVSLAKLKTHHWAGATLSMKNFFGLVPGSVYGWPKNALHWNGIDNSIVELNRIFRRSFAIVRRHRRHGGQWPDPGNAEACRSAGDGRRSRRRGRHLLPCDGHRSGEGSTTSRWRPRSVITPPAISSSAANAQRLYAPTSRSSGSSSAYAFRIGSCHSRPS